MFWCALGYQKACFRSFSRIGRKRWHKCTISESGYFEGDKIVIDK